MEPLEAADPNDYRLIDLDTYSNDNFTLFGFKLSQVLDDIILVQYADTDDGGKSVLRGGIVIPLAHVERAWRIGKVVLAGPKCEHVKVNDFICFPSDKGIPCSNLDVDEIGVLKEATFLNEGRIFGICKPVDVNTDSANTVRNSSKTAARQRRRNKVQSAKS